MSATVFGSFKNSSSPSSELDSLVKQVSGATVKFSNDKILKASGYLRDALQLYKRGEKATQDDFNKLASALESVKADKSSIPYMPHMEAITALLPAFMSNLIQDKAACRDHLSACKESVQFYVNRILKSGKEENDQNQIDWAHSMSALMDGLIRGDSNPTNITATGSKSMESVTSMVQDATVSDIEVEEEEEEEEEEETLDNKNAVKSAAKLQGNRWYIQKVVNHPEPVIITPESINQAVAIEDSQKIAVKIDGKINALLVDKCSMIDLEVGDIMSNIELLSVTKAKIYLQGEIHTLVLDSCEGVQIFLGEKSLNVNILTSKCAEINVLAPGSLLDKNHINGEDANDYVEMAIPMQYSSMLRDGKLVTEAADHIGV